LWRRENLAIQRQLHRLAIPKLIAVEKVVQLRPGKDLLNVLNRARFKISPGIMITLQKFPPGYFLEKVGKLELFHVNPR